MKPIFVTALFLLWSLAAPRPAFSVLEDGLPHLDLEMTGSELQVLVEKSRKARLILGSDPLDPILEMGKRNLGWVEYINTFRPDAKKLQMHSPATQVGIPIDQPRESNRVIIQGRQDALMAELPEEMRRVLLDGAPFTQDPPSGLDDEQFLALVRKADSVYGAASRWLLQEPYLGAYAARIQTDIRGYHFLHQDPDLASKLADWPSLDSATQGRYRGWLIGQCINTWSMSMPCIQEFDGAVAQQGKLLHYFRKYEAKAQETYESFFLIRNPRRDAEWDSAAPDRFSFPFLRPDTPEIENFLASNIEDEWKLGKWQLRLFFRESGSNLAHVVFVPGATPNVNGLGGSRITMDANRPLAEYTNRWTIRHEFGHVLGIPDCYVEFYDRDRAVMVNYQIDVDNLMCSRRGRFQQLHFDELKRIYLK